MNNYTNKNNKINKNKNKKPPLNIEYGFCEFLMPNYFTKKSDLKLSKEIFEIENLHKPNPKYRPVYTEEKLRKCIPETELQMKNRIHYTLDSIIKNHQISPTLRYKNILIVDDISDSGKTLNKISEIFTKIKTPVQNAVLAPLMGAFNIGKGGAQAVGGALGAIGGGLKPAIDFIGSVKGGINNFLGFVGKIPGISGLVNGFKKATTRFDQLFALGEAAVSYGLAVKAAKDGKPVDAGILGELKGQKIGNAILTAAGGFFGSAVGSALGSALGAGVLSGPLGFAGTVIGGMIGEEFGKFASVKIANMLQENNIPNRDPFLSTDEKEIPIFDASETNLISALESDGLAGFVKFFGGGGEEEPQPRAEGGTIPTPAFAKRRFDLIEDYTEYITDTEVVIITKESVVNNVMQTPTIQQGKGGMIPVPIGSGESILDNFRSRALSQLAYN